MGNVSALARGLGPTHFGKVCSIVEGGHNDDSSCRRIEWLFFAEPLFRDSKDKPHLFVLVAASTPPASGSRELNANVHSRLLFEPSLSRVQPTANIVTLRTLVDSIKERPDHLDNPANCNGTKRARRMKFLETMHKGVGSRRKKSIRVGRGLPRATADADLAERLENYLHISSMYCGQFCSLSKTP